MWPCLVLKEAYFHVGSNKIDFRQIQHFWRSYGQYTYLHAGYLGRRRKYVFEKLENYLSMCI